MREARQFHQRLGEDRFVALAVMRRAEGPAHGVIDKSTAGRRDPRHNVERRAGDERGDAAGFDDVRDETNGLVAERSVGDEQRHIDFGSLQFDGDGGSDFVLDLLVALEPAHKRNVKRRQGADDATIRQCRQGRARKDDLGILARHPADAGMMVDDDLAGCRVGRDKAVSRIFPWREGFLIDKTQRRASQERDPQAVQRFFDRAPGGIRRRYENARRLGRAGPGHDRKIFECHGFFLFA